MGNPLLPRRFRATLGRYPERLVPRGGWQAHLPWVDASRLLLAKVVGVVLAAALVAVVIGPAAAAAPMVTIDKPQSV